MEDEITGEKYGSWKELAIQIILGIAIAAILWYILGSVYSQILATDPIFTNCTSCNLNATLNATACKICHTVNWSVLENSVVVG